MDKKRNFLLMLNCLSKKVWTRAPKPMGSFMVLEATLSQNVTEWRQQGIPEGYIVD